MQPTEQGKHWEANGHSPTQILSVLCNPNEHCHAYKIQSLTPMLSHMQNVRIVVAFFFPSKFHLFPVTEFFGLFIVNTISVNLTVCKSWILFLLHIERTLVLIISCIVNRII
jgi:hypothetical protein